MVQVLESNPGFGAQLGRGLGRALTAGAGAAYSHVKEKEARKEFREKFGFDADREQRSEFLKELAKGKGKQALLQEIRGGRQQGSQAQELRGQMPEDNKKRQFLEALPHIEQAIGRELTPDDLNKIWGQMEESPAGHSLQKMEQQRPQQEDPYQEAEDFAMAGLSDMSKVATARAKSQERAREATASRHYEISKETLKNIAHIAETLPQKESALESMRNAIENKDMGFFTKDNLAELTGIEGLRSPESAEFKTASKEFFIGNLGRVGAKGLNQWLEKQISDMAPKIGRSQEANLVVTEALKSELDLQNKQVELTNRIADEMEAEHGYVRRDLSDQVMRELRPYAIEKQKELKKDIENIREKFEPNNKNGQLMRDPAGNLRRVSHKDMKKAKEAGYKVQK